MFVLAFVLIEICGLARIGDCLIEACLFRWEEHVAEFPGLIKILIRRCAIITAAGDQACVQAKTGVFCAFTEREGDVLAGQL